MYSETECQLGAAATTAISNALQRVAQQCTAARDEEDGAKDWNRPKDIGTFGNSKIWCHSMSRKQKAHISLRKKLASALRCLKVEVDGKLVDAIEYEKAKTMTDAEVIALFHFDHGIHEAIDGETAHWNLTPRMVAEHRKKTAEIDIPQIAKTKRIRKSHAEFQRKILAKAGQSVENEFGKIPNYGTNVLKSRPFPKRPDGQKHNWGTRKFAQRGSKA